MATGLVKGAISAVIEKTPSTSSRSCKLRKWGKEIMDKCCQGEAEMDFFDDYCSELIRHLRRIVSSAFSKYKLSSTKREHVWHEFQLERVDGRLSLMWKDMITKLGIVIDDQLLEQSVLQELFELCLKEMAEGSTTETEDTRNVNMSADELNVIRYVSGYVARQLLRKYEKKSGEVHDQFVICLSEMAVEGEGSDLLYYTKKWMEIVNRGGLFPVNDDSFQLFVEIEKCVRVYLPKHLKSKSGNDLFHQNVHEKIIQSEDVQF